MPNPNKLQPSTARVGERSAPGLAGLLWKNVVVEVQFGNGRWQEIARINSELTEDHQRRIAEAIAEKIREM